MEGLKLIDLGNEVSYIDVDTSKVPYTFSVKLGDRTFAFSIRYNEVGGFFSRHRPGEGGQSAGPDRKSVV